MQLGVGLLIILLLYFIVMTSGTHLTLELVYLLDLFVVQLVQFLCLTGREFQLSFKPLDLLLVELLR